METSEITCNQGRTPQENKNFVTKEIENSALKKDLGGQGIQRGQKVVPNQHHEINRKKNSWWKIWQNPNGEIQELPITFISDGIFGLVFFARRPRIVITHWLFLWPNGCGGSPPKLPRFSMLETF